MPSLYFIRAILNRPSRVLAVLSQLRISMSRIYALVVLASVLVAVSATRPFYQSTSTTRSKDNSGTTCYTNTGASGSYMDYFDYAASLGSYDNSFRSCCLYGIWMWYDLQDYNYADFNVRTIATCCIYDALYLQYILNFAATSLLCMGRI